MEDDIHGNWPNPNRSNYVSPDDSSCLNNKSSNNNMTNNNGNNKEQDRFLPIANVGRIMKKVIPSSGKISKDAKETVQECVSEFISFVTGEASDKCQREKRKTINGDDIIWAITTLGFEDYVIPLKLYLNKYRDIEGEKLNAPKEQRSDQQQQQQISMLQDHHQQQDQATGIISPNYVNHLYSTTGLMAPHNYQQAFVGQDQPPLISLPNFSPTNSIQNAYQQQHTEQIDSVGHW
ncbi:Nuclear transcription factor Y subunit B-7 [Dionaea muscipula]